MNLKHKLYYHPKYNKHSQPEFKTTDICHRFHAWQISVLYLYGIFPLKIQILTLNKFVTKEK